MLVIRWFQYAVFCPLLRMHGHRLPHIGSGAGHTGGPNELWSYGERAYEALRPQLDLRTRITAYLLDQMDYASQTGVPPMRPLCLEFPYDPVAAALRVEDQFLVGPDVMVAPVTELGMRERRVYLPLDATWTDAASGRRTPEAATSPSTHRSSGLPCSCATTQTSPSDGQRRCIRSARVPSSGERATRQVRRGHRRSGARRRIPTGC